MGGKYLVALAAFLLVLILIFLLALPVGRVHDVAPAQYKPPIIPPKQ